MRSPNGGWYIDPLFRSNPNLYVSYHGQQLNEPFPFVEHALRDGDREAVAAADAPEPNPPTGTQLRNYRLALITAPGYSAYVGGPAAVTAAKVALMNCAPGWAGTCRELRVLLVDGTLHTARFKFK